MDQASSPNETSAEKIASAEKENASRADAKNDAEVTIFADKPATLISDRDASDAGRKIEIRINLGFDDGTLQNVLSSLKNDHRSQPHPSEYISLTAPLKDEALAANRRPPDDDHRLRVSPIALLVLFVLGFGLKLHFPDARLPAFPDRAASSINALVDRIVMSESGGNPNARNGFSSAAGLGQFVSATWLELIQRHRPDLAGKLTANQILDLRKDPELSREMTARYVEQNTSILMKKGLPVTPGALYLAHFAGPGGAAAILAAPEDIDAATVIASVDGQPSRTREKIIIGNPFLKSFTVRDLKNWAHLKMQGISLELGATPEENLAPRD